jgi:beta-glucanase (GH16 family)
VHARSGSDERIVKALVIGGALLLSVGGCGSDASPRGESNGAAGSGGAGVSSAGADASGRGGNASDSMGGADAGRASSSAGDAATQSPDAGSAGNAPLGGIAGSAGAAEIVTPVGYQLIWHDEFDVDGAPNPANYKFEKGFVRNEEAQWYQATNATVKAGLLVIEARKETVSNPGYTGSGDWKTTRKTAAYSSASLNTSGLWSFQYGHFEMRARIPTAAGMWPAWWTLGIRGQWPSNGEVDIMEFYQGKLLANVGWGTSVAYEAKWDSTSKPLSALGANFGSQFHVWTMDWDEQSIVLSVDGQSLNTTALSSALNADGTSPFKQKAYLLVNLAIGGLNGGDPSKTSFPQRFEIDYLRVFQKQ